MNSHKANLLLKLALKTQSTGEKVDTSVPSRTKVCVDLAGLSLVLPCLKLNRPLEIIRRDLTMTFQNNSLLTVQLHMVLMGVMVDGCTMPSTTSCIIKSKPRRIINTLSRTKSVRPLNQLKMEN